MKHVVVLCLVAAALVARADKGPPMTLELIPGDGSVIPASGELVEFTLRLESTEAIGLQAFDVESSRDPQGVLAWEIQSLPLPTEFVLEPDTPQEFTVQLVAQRPEEPLHIAWRAESHVWRKTFRMLPPRVASAQRIVGGIEFEGKPRAATVPAQGDDPAIDLTWTPPLPEGEALFVPEDADLDPAHDDDAGLLAKSSTIRIFGELGYRRSDDKIAPVDGAQVLVVDVNVGSDLILGTGVTGSDGAFDFDVPRGLEAAPDIRLFFVSRNGLVTVRAPFFGAPGATPNDTYSFATATFSNLTAAQYDAGMRVVFDATVAPAFHQLSVITKTWRYLHGLDVIDGLVRVNVRWPELCDPPFYSLPDKTIHMNEAGTWFEDVIVHEFGHHWLKNLGTSPKSQYCNPGGYADSDGDCGHTWWCEENLSVPWTEGLPNYLGALMADHMDNWYLPVLRRAQVETLSPCGESGSYAAPDYAEGFVTALLYDITDSAVDDDPYSDAVDLAARGARPVLETALQPMVPTAQGFLAAYLNRYPQERDFNFWSTAANNGFELDTTAPGAVSGLVSTTHTIGVESGNDRITVQWNAASDDLSQVAYYLCQMSDQPAAPSPAVAGEIAGTEYTSPSLAVTTDWYVNVAAVDNAGNVGPHASVGPFPLRNPIPADFSMENPRGWTYPVVPRTTNDSTAGSAPLPSVLLGEQSTWMNYQIQNLGELPNPNPVTNRLWLDGVLTYESTIPSLDPGSAIAFVNLGPSIVHGGRHLVSVKTDATGAIREPDESNNRSARQFVWSPFLIGTNTPVSRAAPPDPFGGFETVGVFSTPNCDGVAYVMGNEPFTGVAIIPGAFLGLESDPDLRVYEHTAGPTDGFDSTNLLASSNRPAGAVDVVVSNRDAIGNLYDAGVTSSDLVRQAYTVERLSSSSLGFESETTFTMPAGDYAELRHFSLPGSGGSNHGTVRVHVEPAAVVWAAVIEPGVAHLGWDQATVVGGTNRDGDLVLDFTYDASQHGLVLVRDRQADGSPPPEVQVTLWAGRTPANLRPGLPNAGWAEPVAPTNAVAGLPTAVPAPAVLQGNVATTFLNTAIRNDGPNGAAPLEFNVFVDGTIVGGAQVAQIAGLANHVDNDPVGRTVRGGRHALWAVADRSELVDESNESDNAWGRQWVWSPRVLADATPVLESAPDDAIGGLGAVATAQTGPFHLNAVGFRTTQPTAGDDGFWQAVAVAPGASSDVDVRLHEVVSGVDGGFAIVRASSNAGVGETDYVLTNFRVAGRRAMDAGVVAVEGAEDFRVQRADSKDLGTDPEGEQSDVILAAGSMLALFEVELTAGPQTIDLLAVDGAVDWGMTLHRANVSYHSKTSSPQAPSVWSGPAGASETLAVDVPQSGRYCLAVWKATSADVDLDGTFRLRFGAATSVPEVARAPHFGLRRVAPNPFNPRTVVSFEIEVAAHAVVDVYDLRGARVRRLHGGELAAGRHEVTWNGLDDRGRRVASGSYMIRLESGGRRDVRKAVLVK